MDGGGSQSGFLHPFLHFLHLLFHPLPEETEKEREDPTHLTVATASACSSHLPPKCSHTSSPIKGLTSLLLSFHLGWCIKRHHRVERDRLEGKEGGSYMTSQSQPGYPPWVPVNPPYPGPPNLAMLSLLTVATRPPSIPCQVPKSAFMLSSEYLVAECHLTPARMLT